MTKLQQIEKLTGGSALLTQQPTNDFFPAPHWFLQTADGGKFGATSKRDLLASVAEFLGDEAAEQSFAVDLPYVPDQSICPHCNGVCWCLPNCPTQANH